MTSCGLSFDHTLEIIRDKVLEGRYNGRDEVLKGLMAEGFKYSEAKEVTDYYFKVYRRLSTDAIIKKPKALLNAKEKLEKKVNNLAVAYLNGELGAFPMEKADFDHLQEIYDKEAKADTPTLKAKYIDEANVFVQKFMPDYTNELFKTSVYARPLLSAVFFIKSITSNLHAQIERSIFNTIWDGKKIDFNSLNKFNDLANNEAINVLKGGVPATSLFQGEAGYDPTRGRIEEYSLKGTSADSTAAKAKYYSIMKFMSKWSNRFNSAPDTRGIFHNAERHMYQLLKEKYRSEGKDNDEATQLSLRDMELDDINVATQMAMDKFNELGLEVTGKNGKPTSEFRVAVSEYQRMKRDDVLWRKALLLSKNDFWKKNMMVASELGFGDTGVFGLKARAFGKLREIIEKKTNSKISSAFNLTAFGFINGAANFAEDALERFPIYAAIKIAALQAKKGNVTDEMLQNDIMRRQKDLVGKNITTAMFFLAAKMIESQVCPGKSGKATSEEISSGRTQIGVCGIPVVVPPQMMAMYKVYNILTETAENDDEFFGMLNHIWPVLVQSNQVGLGGAIDNMTKATSNYASASAQGNKVRADEEWDKGMKSVVRYGADVGNTFLPLPSRGLSEIGVTAQRLQGISQKQMDLPFAINEKGKKLGFFNNLGKVAVASLGNVTGISEIIVAAQGSNKNYAVDWQGRKIVQFRGSDITGSGIQYNFADDIIHEAGIKAPYVYRLEKVPNSKSVATKYGHLKVPIKVSEIDGRYLTDHEFFSVSEALGKFNENYFEKNRDKIVSSLKKDKAIERKALDMVFSNSKKAALKAVSLGKKDTDEILDYINRNWEPKRGGSMSTTKVEEE